METETALLEVKSKENNEAPSHELLMNPGISGETVRRLLDTCLGLIIFIPKDPKAGNILSRKIGLDHAQELAKTIGGKMIVFPVKRLEGREIRNKKIRSLLVTQKTSDVAMAFELSDSTILRIDRAKK